jgi:hypothetical protein
VLISLWVWGDSRKWSREEFLKVSLERYNELLTPARQRFEVSAGLIALRSMTDRRLLESFLLYFCAVGSQMTEPVEGWLRRAADQCAAIGFVKLAEGLRKHACAESGHHLMMIADLRALATHWNAHHTPAVAFEDLLRQTPGPGTVRYRQVHEDNIAGGAPYAQIAIEYEIEQLPLMYGELLIARCLEVFGAEILPKLSFVTAHVELDIEHTKFNARELAKLIDLAPECLPALVAAGSAALDAYAQFLTDCVELAKRHSNSSVSSVSAPSLSWEVRQPLEDASHDCDKIPVWLEEVRSLRAAVLYDDGRRPAFKTEDGHYVDPDPMDTRSYHVLAYHHATLAGCVRIYPLHENPPCLTETLLGQTRFSEMLLGLGGCRGESFEIGRWVANPVLRTGSNLAGGLGLQLAAAAGALVLWLVKNGGLENGIALSSVGTRDGQDAVLARFGLTIVPGIEPVLCDRYDDTLRVMYCASTQMLRSRFLQAMNAMTGVIGLNRFLGPSAPRDEYAHIKDYSGERTECS